MTPALSLTLESVLGTTISDAIIQARAIAEKLGLAFVEFHANGSRYIVYQNGTVMEHDSEGGIRRVSLVTHSVRV